MSPKTPTGSKRRPAAKHSQNKRPRKETPAVPAPSQDDFLIAAIGASAGGMEAFQELMRHLPGDTGMGF